MNNVNEDWFGRFGACFGKGQQVLQPLFHLRQDNRTATRRVFGCALHRFGECGVVLLQQGFGGFSQVGFGQFGRCRILGGWQGVQTGFPQSECTVQPTRQQIAFTHRDRTGRVSSVVAHWRKRHTVHTGQMLARVSHSASGGLWWWGRVHQEIVPMVLHDKHYTTEFRGHHHHLSVLRQFGEGRRGL